MDRARRPERGDNSVERRRSSSGRDEATQVLGRPRRLGPYRLLSELGHGGMADVFLAENVEKMGADGKPDRCVIKLLRTELAGSEEYVRMFDEEVRLSRALHHPNIVRTLDGGVIGGAHYLALEHCPGRNLGQTMKNVYELRHAFPLDVAVFVAHELALALAYVHGVRDAGDRRLGLVHRDVSPSNVMLTQTGEVKLLDFGVATTTRVSGRPRSGLSESDAIPGKLRYMAPEHLQGKTLDGRADLFALGVVLWEMVAGRHLFSSGSPRETAAEIVGGPPAPLLRTLRPDVPLPLETIVARLLEREPGKRFQSGRSLASELAPLQSPRPHGARALAALVAALAKQFPGQTPAPRKPSPRQMVAVKRTPRQPPPLPTPLRSRLPSVSINATATPPRPIPRPHGWPLPPPPPSETLPAAAASAVGPEDTQLLYRRRPAGARLLFIVTAAALGFAGGALWQRGLSPSSAVAGDSRRTGGVAVERTGDASRGRGQQAAPEQAPASIEPLPENRRAHPMGKSGKRRAPRPRR